MKLRRNKMKEKRHESSQYAIVSDIVESYLHTRREQYIRQVLHKEATSERKQYKYQISQQVLVEVRTVEGYLIL